MKKNIIAAVAVLYNPSNEIKENIDSYLESVDRVYCIDNSIKDNSNILQGSNCKIDSKIRYIPLKKNIGLASALNLGCRRAIDDGANLIVTFDQDTVCDNDTINKLYSSLIERENSIVVPNVKCIYRGKNNERIFTSECLMCHDDENVTWAITSGTMFFSEIYSEVGGFDDKLFIAQIDQDFCYRLMKKGYSIFKLGEAYIFQELGKTTIRKLLCKKVHVPNLDKTRYYYIFRNERYLRKKWGREYDGFKVELYKYIFSILLFENDKYNKIMSCMKGYFDGKDY